MIMTPHIAVGAAIGAMIANPVVAIPAALLSHYVLDSIPHWQETLHPYRPHEGTYRRVAVDLLCASACVLLIAHWHPLAWVSIIVCAAFALLPDIDSIIAVKPELNKGLAKLHWTAHCAIQTETSHARGIIPQIAVTALALWAVSPR